MASLPGRREAQRSLWRRLVYTARMWSGPFCCAMGVSLLVVAGCNESALSGSHRSPDSGGPPRWEIADMVVPGMGPDLAPDAPVPDAGMDIAMYPSWNCRLFGALQANAPWPMKGGCPTHEGRSPFVGTQVARIRWSVPAWAFADVSPVIGADRTVYYGSLALFAIDGATGRQKWSFSSPMHSSIATTPALGEDGTVYAGTTDGTVYAIDGATGKEKWSFLVRGRASSPTIGPGGTVYVGSTDRYLYALDGRTGTQKWSLETAGLVYSSPAIDADGTVYIGSLDLLYVVNGATGELKWTLQFDQVVSSSVPVIGADRTLYIWSTGTMYAVDLSTRQQRWSAFWGSCPAIGSDGTLYVAPYVTVALDRLTGNVKWSAPTTRSSDVADVSPAIGADGTVYVGTGKGLYALDGITGKTKWTFAADSRFGSPAIDAEGTVYVGGGGNLYAIGP